MSNLRDALEYLEFSQEQHNALIKLLAFAGIFPNYTKGDIISDQNAEDILNSDLNHAEGSSVVEKFNELCQQGHDNLRKGGERQQMLELKTKSDEDFEEIKKIIEFLGLTEEIALPKDLSEGKFVVFGAAEKGLKKRLEFLNKQLEKRQKENCTLYLLGGERNLWPKYSGEDIEVKEALKEIKFSYEDATSSLLENLNKDKNKELKTSSQFQEKIDTLIEEYIKKIKKKESTKSDLTPSLGEVRNHIAKSLKEEGYKYPTESDLALYLAKQILGIEEGKIKTIEGMLDPNRERPTTETTLQSFFIEIDKSQNEALYFVSSQPHIERQEREAKRQAKNNGLDPARVRGIGPETIIGGYTNIADMVDPVLININTRCKDLENQQQPSTSLTNPNHVSQGLGPTGLSR